MITVLATQALEKIINRYLRLDPQTFAQLAEYDNKIIKLEFTEWGIEFYLRLTPNGINLFRHYDGEVDTRIKTSVVGLWQMHRNNNFTNVVIEGDIELGQQIRQLLQSIDIDWEEQLAKAAGDVIAHRVVSKTKDFLQWCKQAGSGFQQNITEYLQEEKRQLPSRYEVNDFFAEVDRLRHDVERLEARLNL